MAKICFSLVFVVLVALHMGSNLVEASPVDGEVMWSSSDLDLKDKYKMPLSCKGMSYCFDKGEDYPESTIEELVDKTLGLVADRSGTTIKDNPDCPVNRTFIDKPIYYILDENDKVRPVAQSPTKFEQIYSVKWCQRQGRITEDTPHFLKGSRTLQKYSIECVNKYMDADFLVLSDEGDKLQHARPKGGIPICCRCRYSK